MPDNRFDGHKVSTSWDVVLTHARRMGVQFKLNSGRRTMTDVQLPSLLEAVLAFQAEAPTLPKDAINPHFRSKYTPLDTIVETIRPLLGKHGLVWMTLPVSSEGRPALFYRLAHAKTGEQISGTMAARLDRRIAGIVGDAVDHRLRPGVHVLEAHVGEAGDVLQAFGRQRQRERLAEIGAAFSRKLVEDAVGMSLELPDPGIAHRARRHRGKHRRAFRHASTRGDGLRRRLRSSQ